MKLSRDQQEFLRQKLNSLIDRQKKKMEKEKIEEEIQQIQNYVNKIKKTGLTITLDNYDKSFRTLSGVSDYQYSNKAYMEHKEKINQIKDEFEQIILFSESEQDLLSKVNNFLSTVEKRMK